MAVRYGQTYLGFELIGYSVHITEFLALVKVLFTYIWRQLAKVHHPLFTLPVGIGDLNKPDRFFQVSALIFST